MFEDSPLELTITTIKYLPLRDLFTLAQTNKLYCDLSHEELFSRPANTENQRAQRRLVQYWCNNPAALLKKSVVMRQRLIKKLLAYIQVNTHLLLPTLESIYVCLTLLSVADSNVDQFQENFIRLNLVSDFDIPVLLSTLVKSLLILKNDQDNVLFNSSLAAMNQSSDYKELMIQLIRNNTPIDPCITIKFTQALIEDLKNSPSVTDLNERVKACRSIYKFLTSDEAFDIVKTLLNRLFDFSFYTNPLQEDNDQPFDDLDNEIKSLLEKLASKLTNHDRDQVYETLCHIFDGCRKKPYPSKMSTKIYYVLQAFVKKFSSEQKSQCFDLLLEYSKSLYQLIRSFEEDIESSLIMILEQDEPDAFSTNFASLVNVICSKIQTEAFNKYCINIEKDYDMLVSSFKKVPQEFPLQVKQEFILFLKLVVHTSLKKDTIKTVCDKLLKTTRQLLSRFFLMISVSKKDDKYFSIIITLNHKHIWEVVNAGLLNPKIPKGLIQQGLINLTEQNLSLEKVNFSSQQADEYFTDFLKLPKKGIPESIILIYLARLINKDLAYKQLEEMINHDDVAFGFLEPLATVITLEQIEELVLKLIEKFQITPNTSLKEHNALAEILLIFLAKLPKDKVENIYLPKLLALQNTTTIKYIFLTRFPSYLGSDVIKKLVSECLMEVKEDLGYILAKDLASRFTEDQILEYYEYVLTCLSSKENLKTFHGPLLTTLMKKFTAKQLINIFNTLSGKGSNFIFKTVLENVFFDTLSQIDIEKLHPLYLELQQKLEKNGKIGEKTVQFAKECYYLVKQLYDSVFNFMNAPSLSSDDSGVLKPK